MNLMPEEIRALCEKFSALHDGQLDASEVAALEKVLHENQTARRLYVRYSRVCGGLDWDLSRTAEDVAPFAPESTAMRPADAAAQQSTIILEGLADTGPSNLGMFVPFQPLAVLASAIGISILAVAALFIFGWPAPDGREPAIAVKGDQSPLEVKSVRLAEGTATILLPQVGYAIVEGPAEFDVVGPLRARLASGKIRVRVTEKSGRGFVLETPYGEIVDWGTEYAVDLQEKGRGGLVVFEGAVDLRVSESKAGDGAESVRNERLVGGEGVAQYQVSCG
jgi:ferric-dicitrate binding protein FerR (iron transport regulator)